MPILRFVIWTISIVGTVVGASTTSGQEYPNRPVHIATSEAGGAGDLASRIIAQGLAPVLGQQVVVENRPTTAAEIVAKAPPDGYTLLHYGNVVWLGPLMRKVQWDPLKDFSPIMFTVRSPNLLVVTPSLPAKSVKELLALAKARPGQLNYASSSTGSSTHLAAELFNAMAEIKLVRVNYKGVAQAITDIIRGEVQLMFVVAGSVMPHIKSGKLRALAVTSAKPSALFPGLPTVAASGVPNYESSAQFGLFAPANTPASVITRVNQDVRRVLNRPDVKEKFFNAGAETVGSSPEEFAAMLKSETAKWAKVIKNAGISVE